MTHEQASPHTDPLHYVIAIQAEARTRDFMTAWTIYNRPSDHPEKFVARCFAMIRGTPEPQPTDNFITSPTLKAIRMVLRMAGLACIPRTEGDEPQIVETWL